MKKCTECNCENSIDSRFCKNCGNSFNNISLENIKENQNNTDEESIEIQNIKYELENLQKRFGFLIISKNEFYVQFHNDMLGNFRFEVVSDYFVSEIKNKAETLKKLGFKREPKGNYYKTINFNESTISRCIQEIQQIFLEVFEIALNEINIESDQITYINNSETKNIKGNNFTKTQKNWFWGLAIFIFVIYLISKLPDVENSSKTYIIDKECYAAISKEKLEEIYDYAVDEDYQAVSQLLNRGDVFLLPKGAEVYVVDVHLTYYIVRFKGSTQNLFITSGVLQKKTN